jgi:hypothetical protein
MSGGQPSPRWVWQKPGTDELYDTLDDFPDACMCSVEELDKQLLQPLCSSGCVGVVISGQAALTDPSDGYWGRVFRMETGEYIQVRVCPRGVAGVPPKDAESRMIGIRRTAPGLVPVVSFAVAFLPQTTIATDGRALPLSSARTIGCRGIQLLLPSLFNMHDPHRDKSKAHADIDLDGFHSVRPSTLTVTNAVSRGRKHGEVTISVCPGDSYVVLAGHMAGVNIPDPLTRPSMGVTDSAHQRRMHAKIKKLTQGLGETKAGIMLSSSLTIMELLGAEGVIGMMCNAFLDGVLPDMMHSPIGTPLIIVMAVQIACFPERYKLPSSTDSDRYACKEVRALFETRWNKVMTNGFRAIDCAISSGYDNAKARVKQEKTMDGMGGYLEDTMAFWQRVGQRVACKLMSEPSEEGCPSDVDYLQTRFGRAELVDDPVSAAKYAFLAKRELAQPPAEVPINRLYLAPKADLRSTLFRAHDSVETWLRSGKYGHITLSKPNVNVASKVKCDKCNKGVACECIPTEESSSSSDDEDDLLDNKLNQEAMESGASAISAAMIHGAFVVHQFGIKTYLVGDGCNNKCADCDKSVGVLQGVLLCSRAGECALCNRRRCYACATEALKRMNPSEHCARCAPGAYGPRKQIVRPLVERNQKKRK